MIPIRAYLVPLLAVLMLLAIGVRASAADEPRMAAHGKEGALGHARARGYSERQITEAMRCLRP